MFFILYLVLRAWLEDGCELYQEEVCPFRVKQPISLHMLPKQVSALGLLQLVPFLLIIRFLILFFDPHQDPLTFQRDVQVLLLFLFDKTCRFS